MSERTEFGFQRTIAFGATEVINCIYMPGYLVPSDLQRMADAAKAEDVFSWALENLLASPGATVMKDGVVFNIRTLVPRRSHLGSCKFLQNESGMCSIHAAAPFGCAFFDTMMSAEDASKISAAGLAAIQKEWDCGGLYAKIWLQLEVLSRKSKSPTLCRREIQKAIGVDAVANMDFKVFAPKKTTHRKRPFGR